VSLSENQGCGLGLAGAAQPQLLGDVRDLGDAEGVKDVGEHHPRGHEEVPAVPGKALEGDGMARHRELHAAAAAVALGEVGAVAGELDRAASQAQFDGRVAAGPGVVERASPDHA